MVRRAAIITAALAVMLASVGRADEPTPTPGLSLSCDEVGCGGVRYEEILRGGAAESIPGRWTPIGDSTMFKAAAKQPIEREYEAEVKRWREALTALGEDDTVSAAREGGAAIGVESPEADRPAAAPDDREFLDVVLVGNAHGYHCTGMLVAPTAVLTAAHCAPAATVGLGLRARQLLAQVAVVDATLHPRLDVALLRLARAVPLPIRPRRRAVDRVAPASMVRLVGFGVDDVRHPTSFGVKRSVEVPAAGWGCDRGRVRSTRCQPGAELLLIAVGGADTCRGDSGGPVLEPTDNGYRLLAITSRSTASGGAPCGRGGIYVRADAIDPWLTSLLEARP